MYIQISSEDPEEDYKIVHDLMDCYIDSNPLDRALLEEAKPFAEALNKRCYVTYGLFQNLYKSSQ